MGLSETEEVIIALILSVLRLIELLISYIIGLIDFNDEVTYKNITVETGWRPLRKLSESDSWVIYS